MVDIGEWAGLVMGREDPVHTPVATMALRRSSAGGSGAFLVADEDDGRWWIKL
jgi:hypothetical protein